MAGAYPPDWINDEAKKLGSGILVVEYSVRDGQILNAKIRDALKQMGLEDARRYAQKRSLVDPL